jgi:IS4 transposase
MKRGSGNNKKILNQINKLTLSLMVSSISFIIGVNAFYNTVDIIRVIVYASIRRLSIEGSSEELMNLCKASICSPDVVQRRIHQKSEQDILKDFEQAKEHIFSTLRKMRYLFHRVTVAIDFTDKLYYGDKNDKGVVGIKHQRGTSYCFRYITLNIVIGDAKVTLVTLPVKPLSDKAKLVDRVLTEAEGIVRINLVLLDRGFFTKDVIKVLEKHQVKFLFPVPKNKLVKQMIKQAHKNKDYIGTYIFKQGKKVVCSFTVFFILNPDSEEKQIWKRYYVFGTNLPVTNNNRVIFAEIYRKRWNIETNFRVEKHEFLAQTTSKSCRFRLFLFLVAIVLYNLWVIARLTMGVTSFYVRRWKISLYLFLYSWSSKSFNVLDEAKGNVAGF